jgi:hypothetical protein
MTDSPTLKGRRETPWEEGLRKWFAEQSLGSLDSLEAAARTMLSLATALIGTLFTVLTIAAEDLPTYLQVPGVRALGAVSVGAFLVALVGALGTLLPSRVHVSSHRPDEQARAFQELLEGKSRWLTGTAIAFGVGVGALGIVLIAALLTTP